MSDVLPFPERVTLDIKKLAQWLADARDLGFSEGMLEANASDISRMEAMVERNGMYETQVRLYMAMIRAGK
jgi:hypothetical protein